MERIQIESFMRFSDCEDLRKEKQQQDRENDRKKNFIILFIAKY